MKISLAHSPDSDDAFMLTTRSATGLVRVAAATADSASAATAMSQCTMIGRRRGMMAIFMVAS